MLYIYVVLWRDQLLQLWTNPCNHWPGLLKRSIATGSIARPEHFAGGFFEVPKRWMTISKMLDRNGNWKVYPLVNIQKAIENGHRNSGFTH